MLSRTGWTAAMIAALCGLCALGTHPAAAETRAVVVGIDDYANIRRLRGALNDANDIAGALRGRGVRDLTVLTDAAATRASVLASLQGLIARVRPGDLVVVSFAGHGGRETWGALHPPDVQTGETYEVFLLRDFAPPDSLGRATPASSRGFGERILGREMREIFVRLEQGGARTVFVADTCHGGGLTRGTAPGAPEQSYRTALPYPTPADGDDQRHPEGPSSSPAMASAFEHLRTLPNLTFLAAVSRDKLAPEVEIPASSGTMRGALSYAFARLIEGQGDADRNSVLTRVEAFQFTRSTVRQYAQFRQTPELQPSEDGGGVGSQAVIDFRRDTGAVPPTPAYAAASRAVRVFVEGGEQPVASRGRTGDLAISTVRGRDEADLIWDPRRGTVVSRFGDVLAEGVKPEHLDALAEREVALRDLIALGQTRPPSEIRLEGGDRRYCRGETVRAQAHTTDDADPYYVLFNVAGDGTVQYLYPRAERRDPLRLPRSRPFFEMQAVPPFGADTLVLLVSATPLGALADALRALDGERVPLEAVVRIKAVGDDNARITTQAIFTATRSTGASAGTECRVP